MIVPYAVITRFTFSSSLLLLEPLLSLTLVLLLALPVVALLPAVEAGADEPLFEGESLTIACQVECKGTEHIVLIKVGRLGFRIEGRSISIGTDPGGFVQGEVYVTTRPRAAVRTYKNISQ